MRWPHLSRRAFVGSLAGMGSAGAAGTWPARAASDSDGVAVLRAASGEAHGLGSAGAPAYAFGAAPGGPVIRVRRGEQVAARLVNALAEPTAIHWHGVRLPNRMDGAPPLSQPPVAPGASFDYRFIAPDAGTFWYHAAFTHQREGGLFGALIVNETAPPVVDRDYVLVFASPSPRNTAPGSPAGDDGRLPAEADGRTFTLNGAAALDLAVRSNERLRLRFINAATAVMDLRIVDHRLFVMALDGQPAEPFMPRDNRIVLGPGNRADVFLDATGPPGGIVAVPFTHAGGVSTLLRLVYGPAPARAAVFGEPSPLPDNALPAQMNFTRARRATVPVGRAVRAVRRSGSGRERGDMPLFVAERGQTVVLALDNAGTAQAVHVHGHAFRLLDRLDDGWKPYWLDTLLVPERQTARVAFVADNPGRWLIETMPFDGAAEATAWFQVN